MKSRFLLFAILFPFLSNAQKHDHYWPMGYNSFNPDQDFGRTVIDFNEEPPLIYREDRELNIDVTMSSYCDSTGNLLLYTNGIRMVNSQHELVENGDSLNTGPFAISDYHTGYKVVYSHLLLQLPGHADSVYLVHSSLDYHDTFGLAVNTLHLTRVDLSANGGEGSVVSKNEEVLTDGNFGAVTAVKHANGRDWWVFNTVKSHNSYNRFLLDPLGLRDHTEIDLEPAMPYPLYSNGQAVFSTDGSRFIRWEVTHGIYIYDFDRCSGEFSNPVFVPTPDTGLGGGVATSLDSRFLYICASNIEVRQYDLWSDDIEGSAMTVAEYDGYQSPIASTFMLMQMGPDGRIYINSTNTENVLHAIQYPDKEGEDCEVRQHSVQLPTYNRFTMPHFPNYRLGPLDGSPCDTLGLDNLPVAKFRYEQDSSDFLKVEFTDLSYYEPSDWEWDFGGTGTSGEKHPIHEFPTGGTYEVCLTVSNDNGEDTFCRTLELGTVATGETEKEFRVSMFPNPAKEGVNVILSDGYLPREGSIAFYNAMGKRQLSQALLNGWNNVRLDGLSPGIYFYEVKDGEMLMDSGKLVVTE